MKQYVEITDPELKKVPAELKVYLDSKRADAATKVLDLLQKLNEPTTVAQLARTTGVSKPLVIRIVMKSLSEDGNPFGLSVKRVGSYDVIWKKEVKHESDGRETGIEGRGHQPG